MTPQSSSNSTTSPTDNEEAKEDRRRSLWERLKSPTRGEVIGTIIAAFILGSCGIGTAFVTNCQIFPFLRSICPPPPQVIEYGFETDHMGWKPRNDPKDSTTRAATAVVQSSDGAFERKSSLKVSMKFSGGPPDEDKGEAYVEINPMNLEGYTITAQVFGPVGSLEQGNGFQVFVKSKKGQNFIGEYGPWKNVTENAWTLVTLTVTANQKELEKQGDGTWIGDGFDPSNIVEIGVKMGSGGKAKFEGFIFIDSVKGTK